MQKKMHRRILVITVIMVLASLLAACAAPPAATAPTTGSEATAAPATEGAAATSGEKIKVGLSFSDFATERWKNEEVILRKLLEDKGYEVLSQEANQDVKLQNDQIDNMVSQGVKGLIIVAQDGDAIVTSVDKAADAGVAVVAYDRLIKSPKIAGYISFNNVEVGRQQADGVMKALDIENWDVTANGPARVVKLGGSPTDNNAILFRQGQDEIVNPLVDAGTVEVVADQWVENWDAANALKLMENILTSANNDVDAVVASNDGTALGALQALKAQGLAGKVPISGQDATADGCNSIVKGELTVSILKDIRNLAPIAVDMVDNILNSKPVEGMQDYTLSELTLDKALQGNVKALFLPVEQVNKENVNALCVENGFQSYDNVYRDIPEDQRPPKP